MLRYCLILAAFFLFGTAAAQQPPAGPGPSPNSTTSDTITLGSTTLTLGGTTTAVTGLASLGITAPAVNTTPLTISGYSLTGSNASSMLDLSGTWNTTGTPTAFDLNITDTASNAASLLLDLRKDGTSQFKVGKDGVVTLPGSLLMTKAYSASSVAFGDAVNSGLSFSSGGIYYSVSGAPKVALTTSGIGLSNTLVFGFAAGASDAGSVDAGLSRDAAGILAQRNAANAQSFRAYNTFTDASNYERAVFGWTDTANVLTIGTQNAGTGVARNIDVVVGGVRKLDYHLINADGWTFSEASTHSKIYVTSTEASSSASINITRPNNATYNGLTLFTGAVAGWTLGQRTGNSDLYVYDEVGAATRAVFLQSGVAALPGSLMVGSATALTLTDGAVGMQKITASASAPGAAGGKMELVCGTNAGTAKLVIAAGTSGTASTILDNIGAGVTGC